MGTVIASGVGSGLDIDGLVTKLVQAEGAPKQAALDLKETRLQTRLSAFGAFRSAADQLRTALAGLTDVAKFQGRKVTVGDESIFAAAASPASVPRRMSQRPWLVGSSMRITCAPNAASHRVAPAPASCPVKSQMRRCPSAVRCVVDRAVVPVMCRPSPGART
jgi:flagellar hook-associated protein 2